ncbi:hypothetical protein OIO90_003831 [Microbotryomycetes sp. JL221]|nr:hypothetical protein OIO90_003831 [Microbotryomycetes sp. JL221]
MASSVFDVLTATASEPSLRSPSIFSHGSTRDSSIPTDVDESGSVHHAPVSSDHGLGIKADTINLPLALPPPPQPIEPVNVDKLKLDLELQSLPIGLVLSKLQSIGRSLLLVSAKTRIALPVAQTLPHYLPCHFPALSPPPSSQLTSSGHDVQLQTPPCLPRPTHVLAIHAEDTNKTLMLTVHGLLYAKHCSNLQVLSCSRHPQQTSSVAKPSMASSMTSNTNVIELPVVHVNLNSSKAFPLLHTFIYTRSQQLLFSKLLPQTKPLQFQDLLNKTMLSFCQTLSLTVDRRTLLTHVELVHGLWQDVVGLGISDQELWNVMKTCWSLLVAAVGIQERRNRLYINGQSD